MAKKKKITKDKSKTLGQAIGLDNILTEKVYFIIGVVVALVALFIITAMISYFRTGQADQSLVLDYRPGEWQNTGREFANYCGSTGALISHFLIARCFGISAFFIPFFMLLYGLKKMKVTAKLNLWKWFLGCTVAMLWLSVATAKFLTPALGELVFNPGGAHGKFCVQWLEGVMGEPGLIAVLFFTALLILIFVSSETIDIMRKILNPVQYYQDHKVKLYVNDENNPFTNEALGIDTEYNDPQTVTIDLTDDPDDENPDDSEDSDYSDDSDNSDTPQDKKKRRNGKEPDFIVGSGNKEKKMNGNTAGDSSFDTPINPLEPYTSYKYPTINLLEGSNDEVVIDRREQEANKVRITEVLRSFGVEIRTIKATVGPTITLYEITPAEGVRINRIKNLSDDIALSLAALGIRIIAPIPGKGTIGIEVPNANPQIVSMQSIINTKKFHDSTMDLPIALGKTITNEVFMVDLAKIPHLLVAGATGQGKSVGLNAIITSLLYKKHPNELKLVLVDPKKVEFSVYSQLANHFMAAIEDNEEEPIITDINKVVNTLKSLCVLMDSRYDLLKKAGARNIKEYNHKYLNHQLSPEKGHDFMPYVVVIIDEFGDLIMTAGKQIEMPIARIAQLARAVGIHMVIATQRPTTNIITGNIKANFPGRIAFRVGAMIDSRTILDRPGANQLVGRGDMLYLNGNEPIRVQCAFVDTPEVERINKYISNQPGPVRPLILPDPPTDDSATGGGEGVDSSSLDPLFTDAARHVVLTQQGSTSMIQRKFSIGYNRAGRLMDQLERAGVVGPASGGKPREVLLKDEVSLEVLLSTL
ncbi:MAG: DNA translocase FtsK 4TM domain-containing protein [Prevotella sp.]|nr:DNA translocase FtsK 4TM domain-containing protein [Prevotella sp.]